MIKNFFSFSKKPLSARRLPGSGLVKATPKSVKTLPGQWRHISIVILAVFLAVVGFERHSAASPADAQPLDQTREQPTVSLPSIQSISLPPIPVKKSGLGEPSFTAANIILIDEASKIVLYEKQPRVRKSIASTTKIASAVVALEHYDLNQVVTIPEEARAAIGSAVTFKPGEPATIEQLLHGLLIVSGNDAAVALAQLMPEGQFVAKMNELAKRLGMSDTYFLDPAGLNDQGYSTASDMAKLLGYALRNKTFAQIVKLGKYEYTSPQGYLHTFESSNRLVREEMYYSGILGGKTGYTPKTAEGGAGHCIVVAASRDGHELIAVVLETYSQTPQASAEVSRSLFDYGYSNFTWQSFVR